MLEGLARSHCRMSSTVSHHCHLLETSFSIITKEVFDSLLFDVLVVFDLLRSLSERLPCGIFIDVLVLLYICGGLGGSLSLTRLPATLGAVPAVVPDPMTGFTAAVLPPDTCLTAAVVVVVADNVGTGIIA